MKTLNLVLVIAALVSPSAFANKKDLKAFITLERIGAQTEEFMSQEHVGLENIDCAYSFIGKDYDCHMIDSAANEGQGAPLELTGKRARALFDILAKNGATGDNGMGHMYLTMANIHCAQAQDKEAGSAAERTFCDFTVSNDNADANSGN